MFKSKTPKARINDIPNVAQPDEMFDGGVCKSKSELHKEIDPYIDSETGMLPKCTDQLSDSSISSSQVSMSTEAAGNEDGFDCCVQLWNILVKIVRLMFEAGNYVLDHKLLFYPLAIIFAYLCLGVLHSIFASILASVAGWVWPPLHFILSTTGGFVWRLADWLFWVDELGRYCRRYRLLCDRQCSFVDRAVEHSHGRAF
uniref:Caveolin n=1 Tax=Meloidogyne javanica TaxID=6303 RepID=A0A915LXI8_MELJA